MEGGSPHPGAAKETPDGAYRYALPTLLLRSPGGAYRVVPGWRPYEAYAEAVRLLCPGLPTDPVTLPADRALVLHRSLSNPERELLTHGPWPPTGAIRVETGNGPLWLHPEEAGTGPGDLRAASTSL